MGAALSIFEEGLGGFPAANGIDLKAQFVRFGRRNVVACSVFKPACY